MSYHKYIFEPNESNDRWHCDGRCFGTCFSTCPTTSTTGTLRVQCVATVPQLKAQITPSGVCIVTYPLCRMHTMFRIARTTHDTLATTHKSFAAIVPTCTHSRNYICIFMLGHATGQARVWCVSEWISCI